MDLETLPKTRAEAKKLGARYYFTGLPCKHGHVAPRKVKGTCLVCVQAEWKASLERRAEYFKSYNKSEAGQEAKARYYKKNRAAVIERATARDPEAKRKYRAAWEAKNPETAKALRANRSRRHRRATPSWLTLRQKREIQAIYRIAKASSKLTKIPYAVDHIYPLQSDVVCGLHVPWNLRIIPAEENHKKSNKLPPDGQELAFWPLNKE